MNETQSSATSSPAQPRKVVNGSRDEHHPGVFLVELEGGTVVDTDNVDIARACARARSAGAALEFELAQGPLGRPRITEVRAATIEQGRQSDAAPPSASPAPSAPTAMQRRPELPHGLIHNPEELTTQLLQMSQHYNVLSPTLAIANMAEGFGANLAIVQIDSTVKFEMDDKDHPKSGTGPDCYWSRTIHKSVDKRSLNKRGLKKIADALGIQWDDRACRRLDDMRQQHYWLWQYVGYIRTHDGQLQTVKGTRELDLRDGSAESKTMTPNQLLQQRSRGNEICETKAMHRAIRNYVDQSYTVDQLKKPFLVVRFSFTPDMSDPAIKKLVTQQAMAGIGALYPEPPAAALPPPPEPPPDQEDDDEDPFAAATGPAAPKDAVPGFKMPADAKFIAAVNKKRTGQYKSGQREGQSWTLYEIVAKTGESWTTFSHEHAKDADFAKEKGWPVRIEDETNEQYPDQLNVKTLKIVDPRQPNLPGTDEGRY